MKWNKLYASIAIITLNVAALYPAFSAYADEASSFAESDSYIDEDTCMPEEGSDLNTNCAISYQDNDEYEGHGAGTDSASADTEMISDAGMSQSYDNNAESVITESVNTESVTTESASEPVIQISGDTGSDRLLTVLSDNTYENIRFAVWSEEAGQDDVVWYDMKKLSEGSWSSEIRISRLKHSGSCDVHIYADGSKFLGGTSFILDESELIKNNITVSGSGINRNVSVTSADIYNSVRLAVWSDKNGQDDLKWYTASATDEHTWNSVIKGANLKHSGKCYIHAYSDTNKFIAGAAFEMSANELPTNTVSVSESGSVRTASAIVSVPGNDIRVAVWSEKNGQDDLRWYNLVENGNGSFEAQIPVSNLNDSGRCIAHFYSFAGSSVFLDGTVFSVAEEEMPKNTLYSDLSGSVRKVTASFPGNYQKARLAVWSDMNGQDDLYWYDMVLNDNGEWSCDISTSNLRHSGKCNMHLYAFNDKASYINGIDIDISETDMPSYKLTTSLSDDVRTMCLTSNIPYESIRVAVWSDNLGQDDLYWYDLLLADQYVWKIEIDPANFRSAGKCYAHAYAGNRYLTGLTFEVSKDEVPENFISVNGTGAVKNIALVNPISDLKNVRAAVWSEASGQDDIGWYQMNRNANGSWSVSVPLSALKHTGICHVHIYSDGKYEIGKTFTVTDAEYFKMLSSYGNDSNIDFIQAAINLSRNESIGYGHTWPKTISCSGLVGLSLTYCGYADFVKDDPLGWGYIYLSERYQDTLINEVGCTEIPFTSAVALKPGDILYRYYDEDNAHISIYVGNGRIVAAQGPAGKDDFDYGGIEVSIYPLNEAYHYVYRIPADKIHYRY